MCALAHYLENAGIATSVISLVRLHSEKINPPRALFVPFELGRPLGDAHDVAGQREVLLRALSMLDHTGPDPMLIDHPDPVLTPVLPWQPSFKVPDLGPLSGDALHKECTAILAAYKTHYSQSGRSVFGISGLSPDEVITLIADELDGLNRPAPRASSKLIRFAIDDLKSLYNEAACLNQPPLSSAQLSGWFWRDTLAARAIIELRHAFAASDDKSRQMIANFLVPGEWIDKLGL